MYLFEFEAVDCTILLKLCRISTTTFFERWKCFFGGRIVSHAIVDINVHRGRYVCHQ